MATSIRLPILKTSDAAQTDSIDAELETFMREESLRLGLSLDPKSRTHWVDKMTTPTVKKSERDNLQILVTGLTPAQDYFVEAGLSGLGYNVRWIGTANQSALQVGKEFGNRGQCNPTHFTVGNLVQELIRLRDEEKISTQTILSEYVFLTAGACGPCRFGMYVTEYRKALRDAGFDGFRVMLFQQQGGLSQVTGDDLGLVFDPPFFLAVARAHRRRCDQCVGLAHSPLRDREGRDGHRRAEGERHDPSRVEEPRWRALVGLHEGAS